MDDLNNTNIKKVIITGATGFIGKELLKAIADKKYDVIIITRNVNRAKQIFPENYILCDWLNTNELLNYMQDKYAIINLAGDNISKGRWNKKKKMQILRSRVDTGFKLVNLIKQAKEKPVSFIQASAIGFYGNRGDEIITEETMRGEGFLADVVEKWENSTKELIGMNVKYCVIRSAVVLGMQGGMLPKIINPFKYYMGGVLGDGNQWFSWIHIEDEINAIMFLMGHGCEGVYNLSSPNPIRMTQLCEVIAKVMNKPCWFKIPAFVLKIIFGEMANELLLTSQRVMPEKLINKGFKFLYKSIEDVFTSF